MEIIPVVKGEGGSRIDLLSLNLEKGIIFLVGPITEDSAALIVSQIFYLDSIGREIQLYISSPGGSVTGGLMIIEAMKTCRKKVKTVCLGMAASMAAVIFSAGEKGNRFIAGTGEIMIHQPSIESVGGMTADVMITARQMERTREKLICILAENTGRSEDGIRHDIDRDFFMNAKEAVSYGIADKIM